MARRRLPLVGATVLSLAVTLVATPAGAGASSAAAREAHGGRPHKQQVWSPRDPETLASTPASPAVAHVASKAHVTASQAPVTARWPVPSQVTVDLGAVGPTRPDAVTAGRAGSLTSGARSAATSTGSSPATVKLTVASHSAAVAAGVSGVIVTMTRADGSAASTSADLAVSYSAWADAFGGNFSDRLTLVRLPACALTTPANPACRKQTPIRATNDRAGQRLVATVTIPAGNRPKTAAGTAKTAGGSVVLAATATVSGANGTYAASSLKSSDSWSAAGNSGSFEWTYPMNTPSSLGPGGASLGLTYDSGSVDGRTTVSNGQTSVVGEGFDLGVASYIETAYKPCAKADPVNWASSGDMCLGVANASISGGTHAGQLVRDDTDTTKWRLATDDGARVQLLTGTTGGSNNTANQAYWKLTGTDGTVYLYGANRLPQAFGGTGADNPTYSTWSLPVFGTGSGTSCNDPTGTVDPQTCKQAWRWNLDFVIDPHGNVTRFTYAREEDFYMHKTATTEYTGGGFLREIDYGWQKTDVATATGVLADNNAGGPRPAATVLLNYLPRCVNSSSNTACPTAAPTVSLGIANTGISDSNANAFSDVPWDQHCNSGSTTCAVYSPAFFSTVRLTGVQTAVNTGAAATGQPAGTPANYATVDVYSFNQSFPAPADGASGNRAQLRLESIGHTGYLTNSDGTLAVTVAPPVNLGYDGTKPNRNTALTPWTTATFDRFRLNQITDELGAVVTIAYGLPGTLSCGSTAPPATIANATLCYPEYYTDSTGTKQNDWFFKYLVTSVTVNDGTTTNTNYVYSKPRTTAYTYVGTPAWHTNDSEQVDPTYRTVDQFRGFGQVQAVTSGESAGANSKTVSTYFQGMDQDPSTFVCINDSHNQAPANANCPGGYGYRDDNALAGQVLETKTYASETSTQVVSDVISVPEDPTDTGPGWSMVTAQHARASGLPLQRAHWSHIVRKITYEQVSTSTTPRRSEIDYTYDNSLPSFTGSGGVGGNGRLILTDDKGDTDASGNPLRNVQELCTFTRYADNLAAGVDGVQWTAFPNETYVSTIPAGQTCATNNAVTAATLVSHATTLFDGLPFPQVSTGDVTSVTADATASGPSVTTATTTYDVYGRQLSTMDADNHTASTAFNPKTSLLPTAITTTNAAGWTTTATVDRGRQVTESITDANNRRSDATYDGMGRAVKVWDADHSKVANPNTPDTIRSYALFGTSLSSATPAANAYVQTQTLREDGSYSQDYTILDGFGDSIESQATPADGSPGLVSTQAEYNSLGKAWRSASAHWDGGNAPSGTFRNYGDALPEQVVTTYDGLSRPLTVAQYSNGALVPGTVTTTAYPGADRVDATGAAGNGIAAVSARSTFTDARGRTTQLWIYHNSPPSVTGNAADADVTTYGFSYTANGSVSTVTDATGKNSWTKTTTDLLGRHVVSVDPDAGTSQTWADNAGLLAQTRDGRGQVLSFTYDTLGRKTAEYNAASTELTLDANNNITAINLGAAPPAASTKLAAWGYDAASGTDGHTTKGQPSSSTRYTDAGTTPYTSTIASYDAGDRPVTSSIAIPNADGNGALSGTYQTTNYYTPVTGLLDHVDLPAAGGLPAETLYNSYNVNGLLMATGGNNDYVVATTYDQLGRITSRTLGDYPYQIAQQSLYDPATGRVTNTFIDSTAGQNGTSTTLNTYSVDYASYTYDAAGQLTSTADLQNWTISGSYTPGTKSRDLQCYTYDYAGRLTNAWTDTGDQTPPSVTAPNSPSAKPGGLGSCASSTSNNPPTAASAASGQISSTASGTYTSPAPYWQSWTFDASGAAGLGNGALTGNRSTEIDHDITGTVTKDVTHTSAFPTAGTQNTLGSTAPTATSGGAGPHLLSSTTASGGASGTDTYIYDGGGNTTTRALATGANQTLAWDAEGRLQSVTDTSTTPNKTASYVYDADGGQLIRRDAGGTNAGTTLYLGTAEIHLANGALSGNRYFAYPGAPEIIVSSTGAVTYEIANNQGTGGTTVNAANGQVISRRYTKPFGENRGTQLSATQWPDDHTFLNKSADTSTGLVDVGARKYDPATGRFISIDPVFDGANPQTVGGYSYAANDPVNGMDPTGLDCFGADAEYCTSGGDGGATPVDTGSNNDPPPGNPDAPLTDPYTPPAGPPGRGPRRRWPGPVHRQQQPRRQATDRPAVQVHEGPRLHRQPGVHVSGRAARHPEPPGRRPDAHQRVLQPAVRRRYRRSRQVLRAAGRRRGQLEGAPEGGQRLE